MDSTHKAEILDIGGLNISEKEQNRKASIGSALEPCDFETAIRATSFGRFNILLFLIALPTAWCTEFGFTSMSYVLPAAQCDLNMTLLHKGMLNAVTYLGSIVSAFMWGFLADTMGRRKIMVWGCLIDSFFVFIAAFFQNFWVLLSIKFINGFLICGPYAVLMSYISEFHCTRFRSPILLLSGIFFCLANVALSGLAWWIIPQRINFSLFNESVVIHSWQIFLVVCALPSLISGCAYLFLPESPKFLMTSGRNAEAMLVFQRVYAMNTGNPPEYFPIKRLVKETSAQENRKISTQTVREGWKQIRPIFASPYLTRIIHIFSILFLGMLGENTLRLWMPQLFTKIDEYNQKYNYSRTASLCEMLNVSLSTSFVNSTDDIFEDTCSVTVVDDQVYINTIIVAMCNVIGFILTSSIVNRVGKKALLVTIYGICGVTGIANYWSSSAETTLALVAIFGGISSVSTTTMLSVMVDLFPTTLRTMTISLAMMTGRSGSIIGNVLFPVLLESGCLPPFLLIGGTALVCSISSIFLPNLKMKTLD